MEDTFLQYDNDEDVQTQLRMVTTWLTKCRKHKACQRPYLSMYENKGKMLPTRLIHIGKNPYSLRLVLSDQIGEPDGIDYVALSHCWGPDIDKVPKTTASNFESRLEGIPWSELSRSFRDAVYVTVQLGYTYLWIDSLCIIQQSKEDFHQECALMHFVYSYASLVVAASGAVDGSIGMLGLWKTSRNEEEIDSSSSEDDYDIKALASECFTSVRREALAQRAWACQERELATRIVHFTCGGIVWECRGWVGSQKTGSLIYRQATFSGFPGEIPHTLPLLSSSLVDSEERKRFMYLKWYSLTGFYTRKKLSNESDRLPALEGLAFATRKAIESCGPEEKYLFGLWRNDIVRGLLWRRTSVDSSRDQQDHNLRKEGIPTWTWASLNASAMYDLTVTFLSLHFHEILKVEVAETMLANELELSVPVVDTSLGRIFNPRKGYGVTKIREREYMLLKEDGTSWAVLYFDVSFAEEPLTCWEKIIKLAFFGAVPISESPISGYLSAYYDHSLTVTSFFSGISQPVELATMSYSAIDQMGLILQAHSGSNVYSRIGIFEIGRNRPGTDVITYGSDVDALVDEGMKVEWNKLILV